MTDDELRALVASLSLRNAGNLILIENKILALQQALGASAIDVCIGLLNDKDADVAGGAAFVLGFMKVEHTVPLLIHALVNSRELSIAIDISHALLRIGSASLEPLLEVSRTVKHPGARMVVFHTLQLLRDHRALDTLLDALHDPDYLVRINAVNGLAQIADVRAVEPLIAKLRDNVMGEDDEAEDGIAIDESNELGNAAAEALGAIGDPRGMMAVFEAMVDRVIWPVAALEAFGEPMLKLLIEELNSPEAKRRDTAASALGEIEAPEAFDSLLHILQTDPDEQARSSAAFALGEIGDVKATGALINALNSPLEVTRHRAAMALGKLGDERAIQPLREAQAREQADWVRHWLVWGLNEILKRHPQT